MGTICMVTQKIAEVLSARSEISVLRRKCDSFEEECEKWKKKQQLAQKMCADLNTVMKRYITDEQSKQKDRVTPIKITRSVGLQVRRLPAFLPKIFFLPLCTVST